jgi:hypothetical protein
MSSRRKQPKPKGLAGGLDEEAATAATAPGLNEAAEVVSVNTHVLPVSNDETTMVTSSITSETGLVNSLKRKRLSNEHVNASMNEASNAYNEEADENDDCEDLYIYQNDFANLIDDDFNENSNDDEDDDENENE